MRRPTGTILVLTTIVAWGLVASATADAQGASYHHDAHPETAYRLGFGAGQQDARAGRASAFHDRRQKGRGHRQSARYVDGYRDGFQHGRGRSRARQAERRGQEAGHDPAYARGFADGFRVGIGDGRQRRRYDPVRHADYRHGRPGYFGRYGSRDAYRVNYREGFRHGYETGYRDGQHDRRHDRRHEGQGERRHRHR